MTADLERILSADEEGRARVAFVQKQIERDLAQARASRENTLAARQQAASAAVDNEVAAIRASGESLVAGRRAALDEYLSRLAAAGDDQLDAAARRYAAIVSGAEGPAE